MNFLIVGLGNIGTEYQHTRHNIGFDALDQMVAESKFEFTEERYGTICEYKFKGRRLILLKPNTYMNLSGKAVNYWLQKEKVLIENLLVIVDDLALPLGQLRLRPKGGDAGHNGLKHINEILGHQDYARLRFGIGSNFLKGQQVDYVLGHWTKEESVAIEEPIKKCTQIIKSFCTIGLGSSMTQFNSK